MASPGAPPSYGRLNPTQSAGAGACAGAAAAAPGGEEPYLTKPASASPAPGGPSAGVPDLVRTDSTPSNSDRISLKSHTSIPVVGTFPLGSLRVHQIMDSPRPRPQPQPDPEPASDMPPLEQDNDSGDVFLILDLPRDSTVGCDVTAIGTREPRSFQGFRDLPPGPHLVWISEPSGMSRCGYWFVTRQRQCQVRVKQWDRFNEVLVNPASDFEVRDLRHNLPSISSQLVPYGYAGGDPPTTTRPALTPVPRPRRDNDDAQQLWNRLTSCIDERLLVRVTGKAEATEWLVDTSDGAKGEAAFPQISQLQKTLAGTGELSFLFPDSDVDLLGRGDDGDTTDDILRLIDTPGTGVADADLVGELQFAFLTGLHLANLSCVEQWWHLLLRVFLRAHRLVLAGPGLAHAFVSTLHAQMVYNERYMADPDADSDGRHEYGGPGGAASSVLDMVPGNRGRLRRALALYKRRLDEMLLGLPKGQGEGPVEVGKAFAELEAWFWRVGWDLRTDHTGGGGVAGKKGHADEEEYDDDDEYRPVVVDLDENGREVGLVSFS